MRLTSFLPGKNQKVDIGSLKSLQRIANRYLQTEGVTFNFELVKSKEHYMNLDVIPREITLSKWAKIKSGLLQRISCLNEFLNDIYNEQQILKDGIIPKEVIYNSTGFYPKMLGIRPKHKVYLHVTGMDLISDANDNFLVLEDNLRTPSGAAYVLENRIIMKRLFQEEYIRKNVLHIDDYPVIFKNYMYELTGSEDDLMVVLSPGCYNSAYYEHCYLAKAMGCPLVQGSDLFVDNDMVYLKTTDGPRKVAIVYRRIDDNYLDPQMFNPDSLLGVAGITKAYAKHNVLLANAIGNGVADDKAIFHYIPKIIKYYSGEDNILEQVETLLCSEQNSLSHILANINSLVIKKVDGCGGKNIYIGENLSKTETEDVKNMIKDSPYNYVAQPLQHLSTERVLAGDNLEERRVDFRPFSLFGKEIFIMPGGLTRISSSAKNFIVNSSSGGGVKDTWIVEK